MLKGILIGCGVLSIAGVVLTVVAVIIAAVAISNDEETQALLTGDADDVTVHVTGDAGAFSGSLGSVDGQRSVDGTTPQSFTIPGEESSGIFTVVIQKQGAAGTLRVELVGCPDGDEATGETSAAYGVVSVSC